MKFTLSIGFCDVGHYLPLARAAEEAGWDAVCVPDGLFWYEECSPYPYSETGERFWRPDTPFLDPFALVAAMGAVTERIRFYTNVLKLPVRNPLLVAKAATSAAALCGDRFGLGVGLSPWREDFDVLGEEWGNRGPRSGEMVEIIRGISRGGKFSFDGEYYKIPAMEIAPAPKQPMPIYFGGLADAVLRRAARLGDGYIWWENARSGIEDFKDMLARLRGYLVAGDRELGGFEIKALPGAADLDGMRRLADLGVTDLIVMPWFIYPGDPTNLDFCIDSVRRFSQDMMPQFDR
jgi:alkanesulfonate monooxygenase SsuD/methylene tetrahydromethanopterin reductase-like flavin-dependent oxidoreductase (luciferase family)